MTLQAEGATQSSQEKKNLLLPQSVDWHVDVGGASVAHPLQTHAGKWWRDAAIGRPTPARRPCSSSSPSSFSSSSSSFFSSVNPSFSFRHRVNGAPLWSPNETSWMLTPLPRGHRERHTHRQRESERESKRERASVTAAPAGAMVSESVWSWSIQH